jgi:hypothetical protein
MAQEPFAVDEVERVLLDFLLVTLEVLGEKGNVIRGRANALIAAAPTGALRTVEFDLCLAFSWTWKLSVLRTRAVPRCVRKATFVSS